MANCLLGLGSNLGEREATLAAALVEIAALPDLRILQRSEWFRSRPIGGPADQAEFLNAAILVETSIAPLTLLAELQTIETRHGRQRAERWAPRTLDIDMLLYGNEVVETEMLTLPHPRMSFRRFVLEPAVEVAPKMLHPVIGWPIERLLLHLNSASDQVAIVSPADARRVELAEIITHQFAAQTAPAPTFATAEQFWPSAMSTWLTLRPTQATTGAPPTTPTTLPYAAAAFPKLTVIVDVKSALRGAARSDWSALVRRPGRGPTLRLQESDRALVQAEVLAAVESVWPDLGLANANRLE